jgi:hypothetical protein
VVTRGVDLPPGAPGTAPGAPGGTSGSAVAPGASTSLLDIMRPNGTYKCVTGASPSFALVPQDGDKPVLAPVEPAHHSRAVLPWLCRFAADLSPASSTGASASLHELLERLDLVVRFLVFCLLLRVRQRVLLPLGAHRLGCAFNIHTTSHDHSPLGSSLPCTSASHCGLDVRKVASLPPEESELRHLGSSPPEKDDFGSGDVDRARSIGGCAKRNQQMRNRHTTVARAAAALPISGRSLPVSSIDALDVMAAG